MIRRAVQRRAVAVIALFGALGVAVWMAFPPPVDLGPGDEWAPAQIDFQAGTGTRIDASIENRGSGDVTIARILPSDPGPEGMLRITGGTLRTTRLEHDEQAGFILDAEFTDCRPFPPGTSAALDRFRVRLDDGSVETVAFGRPVRVTAPARCPGR